MSLTSVQGRNARALSLDSFADITAAPLSDITRDGLLFDGPLTSEQVEAIWWRFTSRDDADEQVRRDLYALLSPTDPPVVDALVRYALGL